jgi:Uma2 family endonuclease
VITAEQYLHTSYQDGDREYLDGVVLERNLGSLPHSHTLSLLNRAFACEEKRLRLGVYPSCRLRITETRYRVPDMAVILRPYARNGLALVDVPFLIVEILELDDCVAATLSRCRDYANLGVPHILLMDPENRETFVFSGGSLMRQDVTGFDIPDRGFLPFDSRELLAQLDDE